MNLHEKRLGMGSISLILAATLVFVLLCLNLCACAAPQQTHVNATPEPSEAKPISSADEPEPTPKASEPQYILIIGDDSWETYTPGHADLMMLMRLDFERSQISLVTVPRDTKYTYPDGSVTKLNQVYTASGAAAQCAAVSEIVGVDVTQYAVVGFDGLQSIVEHFGGLDVNLPYALNYSFYTNDFPNELFDAGEQTITPWRAMALSRTRTSYADYDLEQDMMRQVVDRQMMIKLIERAYAQPTQTGALLTALQGFASTNVPLETQVAWANELGVGKQITVYATSGPFSGDIDEQTQLWLVTPDPDNWKRLMAAVDAGENPAAATALYAAGAESPLAPVSTATTIPLS